MTILPFRPHLRSAPRFAVVFLLLFHGAAFGQSGSPLPLSGRPAGNGSVSSTKTAISGTTTSVNTLNPATQVQGPYAGSAIGADTARTDDGPARDPEHLEDKAWSHRPLVFLNACGSLGYSPDALSPFLKTLVEGREASGVLGTDVPVAEILAGQVACAFMTKFLKEGKQAGQALLEVRQALLAKFNPLGLVYTLFAPAELVVDLYGNCE